MPNLRYLEKPNSQAENRMVVARCWRVGGIVNYCLVNAEFQFGKKKSFWRWMVVMAILQGKCT